MTLRTFRILASFAALLLTLWIGLSILVGLEVGSAYLVMIQSLGGELSVLTASWALPLLGVSSTSAELSPRIEPWVAIIWAILAVAPALVLAWTLGAKQLETVLARPFPA